MQQVEQTLTSNLTEGERESGFGAIKTLFASKGKGRGITQVGAADKGDRKKWVNFMYGGKSIRIQVSIHEDAKLQIKLFESEQAPARTMETVMEILNEIFNKANPNRPGSLLDDGASEPSRTPTDGADDARAAKVRASAPAHMPEPRNERNGTELVEEGIETTRKD